LACTLAAFLGLPITVAHGQQAKLDVLRIGSSGTLTGATGVKEKTSVETLRSFIKDETGLNNEILRQKNWRELAQKMATGQLQIGVFPGYEFAWAQSEFPSLKPLALAVNVYRYPVAYVVARRDDPAKDFAGLQSQSLALPTTGEDFLHLFVERQSQQSGKKPEAFFSKISSRPNIEDAVDDVVDGVVQAAVADRAALEAYKQRKPGRFRQLKMVARSQPLPPVVVAYYDATLDSETLQRFRRGLLDAGRKERGQTILTLFRLTGFEAIPQDFEKVLADTRQTYPPPSAEAPGSPRTENKGQKAKPGAD
jgi:ABC-type phosphate/phosphonate transport system substrate-binding protein